VPSARFLGYFPRKGAKEEERGRKKKKGKKMLFDRISFNKMIFERFTIISHTTTLFPLLLASFAFFVPWREE